MAPSSKSEKDKRKPQMKRTDHIVKLLIRGKLSGQISQRVFRKLPPRVCVPLKNIVNEEFLRAGHIFLGFTKCGRYVLSYTSDCGAPDDFSFYKYHLYWWEFNLHSPLKQVHNVRLFAGQAIFSDLYLTVCEWPNNRSKIVIFGFNTRSSSSVLMNLMMTEENNREIYITIASMPPPKTCSQCCPLPSVSTTRTGGECLEHGYILNSRCQVVYPFPTFQPAFQLKKDQVILLNTSYSLVACSVSLCPADQDQFSQLLYSSGALSPPPQSASSPSPPSSSLPSGSPEGPQAPGRLAASLLSPSASPLHPGLSPLSSSQTYKARRALEFVADIFCRAEARGQGGGRDDCERRQAEGGEASLPLPAEKGGSCETLRGEEERGGREERKPISTAVRPSEQGLSPIPPSSSSLASSPLTLSSSAEPGASEPGYVNYTRLHYCLQQPGEAEPDAGGYQDDKVQLPFVITDLKGRNLQPVTRMYSGQTVCVEQLALDFEHLINEVILRDAAWAPQFCSFSDYDVVILEVCPDNSTVMINIGLMLLAVSSSPKDRCRQKTYHSNLQVTWNLNTGVCRTIGVGDLIEVRGQSSGSVWSSYRKSCINTVMKWLVPESSSSCINRMTNEALHKGSSMQILADIDRCTWIVL